MGRGRFKKLNTADASGDKKPWFEPGHYMVRIVKVKAFDDRNGHPLVVIEAECLESDNESIRVGSVYSQVMKMDQDMGPINLKRFLIASQGGDPGKKENSDFEYFIENVCEMDPKELAEQDDIKDWEDFADDMFDEEEEPLVGTEMPLDCIATKKKDGDPFTKYAWQAATKIP